MLMVALRIVDPFPDEQEPGMMWRYPSGDVDGRECWWVVLPNTKPVEPGLPSRISWRTTDRASKPPHAMWAVTGDAPGPDSDSVDRRGVLASRT